MTVASCVVSLFSDSRQLAVSSGLLPNTCAHMNGQAMILIDHVFPWTFSAHPLGTSLGMANPRRAVTTVSDQRSAGAAAFVHHAGALEQVTLRCTPDIRQPRIAKAARAGISSCERAAGAHRRIRPAWQASNSFPLQEHALGRSMTGRFHCTLREHLHAYYKPCLAVLGSAPKTPSSPRDV